MSSSASRGGGGSTATPKTRKCLCKWGDICREAQVLFQAHPELGPSGYFGLKFGSDRAFRAMLSRHLCLRQSEALAFEAQLSTKHGGFLAKHHYNRDQHEVMKKKRPSTTVPRAIAQRTAYQFDPQDFDHRDPSKHYIAPDVPLSGIQSVLLKSKSEEIENLNRQLEIQTARNAELEKKLAGHEAVKAQPGLSLLSTTASTIMEQQSGNEQQQPNEK